MNEKEKIAKIAISDANLKRVNIIKTLIFDEVALLNDKEATSYIVNKAIEKYFKSDEIQKKMQEL